MPGPQRVLFIGNSFTTRNDVPGQLTALAAAAGETISTVTVAAGGASLRRHWNAGGADRIRGGNWDAVVLQEQSTLPWKNRSRFHENVSEFAAVIEQAGAGLVLYQTWARQQQPENRDPLTSAYREIGSRLGAVVVPVGEVWHWLLAQPSQPLLYADDGSHPSAVGSTLAACVFAVTLYGMTAVDAVRAARDLSDQQRAQLAAAIAAANIPASPRAGGLRTDRPQWF